MSLYQPLADALRPQQLSDVFGQSHLIGEDKPLTKMVQSGHWYSMIFWGPPGVGKTTLAKILAQETHLQFVALSAIGSGVADIRQAVQSAQQQRSQFQQQTLLFVDEVHRFNKSQQDAFLPYIEDGTFIFIGATTENPSFELNNALLSRTRVYTLKPLDVTALQQVLDRALSYLQHQRQQPFSLSSSAQQAWLSLADGDARRLLGFVEQGADLAQEGVITDRVASMVAQQTLRRFDNQGDYFYELISALHKSVRGSDPDASLYWMHRMLSQGADPKYIGRRLIRMASEDIGNADPNGLNVALNAMVAYERLGSPEGDLALSQAVIYLALAPKSNAVYMAHKHIQPVVAQYGSADVPNHLKNAPTTLMKTLDMGKDYRYAHDEPHAYAAGEHYFPDHVEAVRVYYPTDQGLEIKARQKLDFLRQLDQNHQRQS